ncbi:hypothetical protein NDR87_02535 [Nocardia sp. CDC159]|uniref:UsfY protein n=2 Tax=Nocardiaceae TaxID=85025 RepID=A0A9X2E5R6_9NOCA|nr:hypothetical protein [Nocardia pulmonis]MCM6785231.1 hypothetical protein [Nocardia sp. CDC159]
MTPASFPERSGDYRPDAGRTFRSRAGESVADARNWPGLSLLAIGVVALAATLAAAGYGFPGWTLVGAIVAVVCLVGGVVLVVAEHRRVKSRTEDRLRDPGGH